MIQKIFRSVHYTNLAMISQSARKCWCFGNEGERFCGYQREQRWETADGKLWVRRIPESSWSFSCQCGIGVGGGAAEHKQHFQTEERDSVLITQLLSENIRGLGISRAQLKLKLSYESRDSIWFSNRCNFAMMFLREKKNWKKKFVRNIPTLICPFINLNICMLHSFVLFSL